MQLGKKAFTLIELLVVISIIALLLAILVPTLSRARQQAKLTICKANSKQIATLFTLYTCDHDGYMPLVINLHATCNPPIRRNMINLSLAFYNYWKDSGGGLPRGLRPYDTSEKWQNSDILSEYYSTHIPDYFICPYVRSKGAAAYYESRGVETLFGPYGQYTFNLVDIVGRTETYGTFGCGDLKKGYPTMGYHPWGPPHGTLKYAEVTLLDKTSVPPNSNYFHNDDWKLLRPVRIESKLAKLGIQSAEAMISYCTAGEWLMTSSIVPTNNIANFKSHKKGKRGGVIGIMADTHVEWVPGTQVGGN